MCLLEISALFLLENRNFSQVCWRKLGTSLSLSLWVVGCCCNALIMCHSCSRADTTGAAKQTSENASRFIGLNHPAVVKLLQISYNSEYPPFCSLAEVLLLKDLIWQEEDCTCVEGVSASHWQTILPSCSGGWLLKLARDGFILSSAYLWLGFVCLLCSWICSCKKLRRDQECLTKEQVLGNMARTVFVRNNYPCLTSRQTRCALHLTKHRSNWA